MKLRLSTSFAVAASAIVASVLACGCGASTPAPVAPASGAPAISAISATTQLMFADLASPQAQARPAPKVGKAHLVLGEDLESRGATSTSEPSLDSDDVGAPKEARRSDGSRRGGHFGTTK
jgi:hypothetical protein